MVTKKELVSKLSAIYTVMLPYVLVGVGVCNSVLIFLSSDCKVNESILSLTNSTMFENSIEETTVSNFNKALTIIATVFSVLFTAYGRILEKQREELKLNNVVLNEQVESLTMAQRRFSTQDILITPSENSVYPSATQVFVNTEPVE